MTIVTILETVMMRELKTAQLTLIFDGSRLHA